MAKRSRAPGEVVGEVNGFPVRRVKVKDLKPAAYNPRAITQDALDGLKASVDAFGLPQPVVWNKRTGNLVAGHQRIKTLPKDSHTDVVVVDLDEDRERALNLTLNNPHVAGEFTHALDGVLSALQLELPDLVLDLRLAELHLDVPADVDDVIGGMEDGGGQQPRVQPAQEAEEEPQRPVLKQLVLVLTPEEHEEVVDALEALVKEGKAETTSGAVVWLARQR